jgi:exopolyphosphatase/guanosine-5'-triphosphate,3'-diphosphate pyrophosphatase
MRRARPGAGKGSVEGLQDEEGVPGASDPLKSEIPNVQPLPADVAAGSCSPGTERSPGAKAASGQVVAIDGIVVRNGGPGPTPPDSARPSTGGQQGVASLAPYQDQREVYGALDLGTNNCRLLLARPSRRGFQVIDAFSRIIRLGEGVSQTGQLSEAAMRRTIDALRVCAQKIERHGVRRARLVATEACRVASNGPEFLERVEHNTGLKIEILSREGEARLAVSGCASLIDPGVDYVLVFDIGGGSSELVWLDLTKIPPHERGGLLHRAAVERAIGAWTSLPVGVVTLAETFGGRFVSSDVFEAMVDHVLGMLAPFESAHRISQRMGDRSRHLLGTSGTVTTVAGVYLGLPRYDRNQVDGCWLEAQSARDVVYDLLGRNYVERVAEPCIGRDRADLVLAGCAILEALMRKWPSPRLRVADRGLREGILMQLMGEDRVIRSGRRRRRGRRK